MGSFVLQNSCHPVWQRVVELVDEVVGDGMVLRASSFILIVNGLHLYRAFIQSTLQFYASHSPIHTHIHTPTAIGCHDD